MSKSNLPPSDVLAIITARGGSKGIPRKNLKDLAGKPLIAYSIQAALDCKFIGRCIVSTEDEEIARVSRKFGAEVMIRPEALAMDDSSSASVVCHVLEQLKEKSELPDYFVLLQPTSPLRNSTELSKCISSFFESGKISGVSFTEAQHHPFKVLIRDENGAIHPAHDWESLEKPRQKLPKAFVPNGAIYVAPSTRFLSEKTFFMHPLFLHQMPPSISVDIDSEVDLLMAEHYLKEAREKSR